MAANFTSAGSGVNKVAHISWRHTGGCTQEPMHTHTHSGHKEHPHAGPDQHWWPHPFLFWDCHGWEVAHAGTHIWGSPVHPLTRCPQHQSHRLWPTALLQLSGCSTWLTHDSPFSRFFGEHTLFPPQCLEIDSHRLQCLHWASTGVSTTLLVWLQELVPGPLTLVPPVAGIWSLQQSHMWDRDWDYTETVKKGFCNRAGQTAVKSPLSGISLPFPVVYQLV